MKELETWPYDGLGLDNYIEIEFPEFTCLCPKTSYPDFAKVTIKYIPRDLVVELKSLKLWLNSFRNVGISHENATKQVFEALREALKPRSLSVYFDFHPRGNVHTTCYIAKVCP